RAHFRVASQRVSAATRSGNNGFFSSRQMTVRQVGEKSNFTRAWEPTSLWNQLHQQPTSPQVLPHPFFNPRQRLVQILQRVGDAEAEIAFSIPAEGGAGESS